MHRLANVTSDFNDVLTPPGSAMKIHTLIVLLLGLVADAAGQASNYQQRQPPASKSPTELHKLKQEFVKATHEYKASLEKLRSSYEQSVRKAQERLIQSQALYSQGLLLKSDVEAGVRAVEEARAKVSEVTQRIAVADKQIADTLFEKDDPASQSLENRNLVELSDERVAKVIATAEDHFRKGKMFLEDNLPLKARDEFDIAIDSILESGLDIRASQRLLSFYLDLVDRIHLEEVILGRRSNQPDVSGSNQKKGESPQIGFREQKFEPSPLDGLSKLVLTPDERAVNDKPRIAPGYGSSSRNCNSTIIKGAQLRGFHLAMTVSDVKARLPRLKLPVANVSGYARVRVHFNRTQPPPAFLKGVMTMVFDFIDGHVSYIGVLYDDSVKWKSLDQFTVQVAKSLGVPEDWQAYSFKGEQQRMLQCGKLRFVSVMLRAGRTFSPALFLVDDAGIDKLVARKASELERARKVEEIRRQKKLREEEERRRTFKP